MKIYRVNDEKFKSIYLSYNFTLEVDNTDMFSEFSVLTSVMAKSSRKYNTQKDIEKYLNSLYGASFDVNSEKIGDLYNVEFRMNFVNKNYIPSKEDVLKDCLVFLKDMIYGQSDFSNDSIQREKEFVLEQINERKDEKLKYAVERAEELLCKNEPFGTYLYGEADKVENITREKILFCYKKLKEGAVTVIISGNLNGYETAEEDIKEVFKEFILNNKRLQELVFNKNINELHEYEEVKEIQDTAQSALSIGLRIKDSKINDFYGVNIYNAILGTTPSSKLFQNVREKESLAYTVRSRYYRFKSIIVIYAGINKEDYEKALEVIKEQIDYMKSGKITQVEFESAKESLLADLLEWKDSKIAMAKMKLSNIVALKDPEIEIEDMRKNIAMVTLEDVIQIAGRVTTEKVFLLGGENDEKNGS